MSNSTSHTARRLFDFCLDRYFEKFSRNSNRKKELLTPGTYIKQLPDQNVNYNFPIFTFMHESLICW